MFCKPTDRCTRCVKKKSSDPLVIDPFEDRQSLLPNLAPIIVETKSNTILQEKKQIQSVKRTPAVLKFKNVEMGTSEAVAEPMESYVAKESTILKRPLTPSSLVEVWSEIMPLQLERRPGLYNQMRIFQPRLEQNIVYLDVESLHQQQVFEENVGYLTQQFEQYFDTSTEIKINKTGEEKQQKTKLYTPQDRFKRMVELNPAIALLQKELGLDFEYN